MKRIIFLLILCLSVELLHAEYVVLDSLRLTENFTLRQKVILHTIKVPNTLDSTSIVEFVYEGMLYVMSNIFSQDYNEYTQCFTDVPSLTQKIMSICPTDCSNGNCGYTFTYDSNLPSTLTVYTFPNKDTIQYVTTHFPKLHVAIIRDTIFGSKNIRCGISLHDMFRQLYIGSLYHNDYIEYRNIVLIPMELDYRIYQKNGYLNIPYICLILENINGFIKKIEVRQTDYFSKKSIIKDLEFY